MDKRISIFIFSSILLSWTAIGSEPGAEPPEAPVTTSPAVGSNTSSTSASQGDTTTDPAVYATKSTASGSSSTDNTESTSSTSSPVTTMPKVSGENQTETSTTQKSYTASPTKNTSLSKDSSTLSPATTTLLKLITAATNLPSGSSENLNEKGKPKESSDKRYLWILLPVLCVLVATTIYLKFKCKKVQHRPEMTDNGTENASFQRTDSNKDGVMLLGVSKTPSGEGNVIGFDDSMR